MFKIKRRHFVKLAALGGIASKSAWSQVAYPDRPIRLIVPSAPGDLPATFAGLVADGLTKKLGVPVVVDHKPGAGGTIGTRLLLQAPADGYTLLWTYISNQVITPLVQRPTPYHPVNDFAPIALSVANTGGFLVANSGLPFKNPREMFAFAKANPGRLNFASAGVGSITHLALEVMKNRTGTSIVHIPFKGNTPGLNAVIGGEADLTIASSLPAVLPFVNSGRLRLIGRLGPKRAVEFPDVPTFAEDTVPGFILPFWMGLTSRAGTPTDVISKLNKEINAVVSTDPILQRQISISNLEAISGPPSRLAEVVKRDFDVFGKVVQDNNITAE